MMTDALLQLSAAQVVTASAVSTNTIDLSVARDMGAGCSCLYVVFTVDETATAAGAATVNLQLISSAAAALTAPTVLVQSDALAKTEFVAGRRPIYFKVPASVLLALPLGQRYLGVQYTVAVGPLTAGKFSAAITDSMVDVGKNYPSGFTVA